MKFFIHAKDERKTSGLREDIESLGFEHSREDPDFIVSYGGDGTFLYTERNWPGVPKLLVRDSRVCFKCHDEPVGEVLELVKEGRGRVEEWPKLRADFDGEERLAVNDVVVRNKDVTRAIRFRVLVDGEDKTGLLIGDGVVVSTPFGATGYYYSVTRETFEEGIGVAFNNTTQPVEPLVVGEDSVVEVVLERGVAEIAVDNHPDVKELTEGDSIKVEKSSESVKILTHNG